MKPRLASILLVCLITANLFAGPYYFNGRHIRSYTNRLADGNIALMIELTSAPANEILLSIRGDGAMRVFDTSNAPDFSNLMVTLSNAPIGEIPIMEGGVIGVFDMPLTFSTQNGLPYTLTYSYLDDNGASNDIALLIPEPAALMLFALGGLALRKKR